MGDEPNGVVEKKADALTSKEIIEAAKKEKQERTLRLQNRMAELLKEENCRLIVAGSFVGNDLRYEIRVIAD